MSNATIGSRFQNIIRSETGVEVDMAPEPQLDLESTPPREEIASPFQEIRQVRGQCSCYMTHPLTKMFYRITMIRTADAQYRLLCESGKIGKRSKTPLITVGAPDSVLRLANNRYRAKLRAGYTVARVYGNPQ